MRPMRLFFLVLAAIAMIAWCPAIAFIVTSDSFRWFDDRRWAIGSTDGLVASDDAVYVAESNHGRVYKFALDGTVIDWVDIHGKPIRITRGGEFIIIHYSGREWPLENPAFRVHDPGDVAVTLERTWWGHPLLVVRRTEGTTVASLQPWYLTIVQSRYPGGAWPAVAIAFSLAAVGLRKRLRSERDSSHQSPANAPCASPRATCVAQEQQHKTPSANHDEREFHHGK